MIIIIISRQKAEAAAVQNCAEIYFSIVNNKLPLFSIKNFQRINYKNLIIPNKLLTVSSVKSQTSQKEQQKQQHLYNH